MSWISDIGGGIGDAVSSLVSGVESMFSGGGSPSVGDAALSAASQAPDVTTDPTTGGTTTFFGGPSAAPDVSTGNPLPPSAPAPAPPPSAASPWASPIYQGALATGAMRMLGGALTPNPMAMQINAQDTWTKQAIARAAANQNVDKVVIPHVAPATPRKGLIGTNIH